MKNIKLLLVAVLFSIIIFGCGKANIDEGMKLIEAGEYEQAIKSFEKDISAEKNLELAYEGTGIAYLRLKNYQSAILALKEALNNSKGKVRGTEIDICYYLAEAQYYNGEFEDAISTCTNLITYDEKNKNAYYFRGNLYLAVNDIDNAYKDFDKVEELLPKDSEEYHCTRGKINYLKGEINNAIDELNKAIEKGSNDALLYLGMIYKDKGDLQGAKEVLEKYLENDSTNAQVYSVLGMCEVQNENYEKALEYFEKGLPHATGNAWAEIMKNEVAVYEKQGDFEKAKEVMAQYIEVCPNDEAAMREYEFLKTR